MGRWGRRGGSVERRVRGQPARVCQRCVGAVEPDRGSGLSVSWPSSATSVGTRGTRRVACERVAARPAQCGICWHSSYSGYYHCCFCDLQRDPEASSSTTSFIAALPAGVGRPGTGTVQRLLTLWTGAGVAPRSAHWGEAIPGTARGDAAEPAAQRTTPKIPVPEPAPAIVEQRRGSSTAGAAVPLHFSPARSWVEAVSVESYTSLLLLLLIIIIVILPTTIFSVFRPSSSSPLHFSHPSVISRESFIVATKLPTGHILCRVDRATDR